MPLFKRKYAPKRRLVRRKRLLRRRPLRLAPRRAPQGRFNITRKLSMIQTYSHPSVAGTMQLNDPSGTCLTLGSPVLVTGTTTVYDIPFSMKFRLDQLMNSSDITNLADKYRINSVKVKVHANGLTTNYTGLSAAGQPWIEYIADHDDATVPSISQIREKMGVKTKYFSGVKAAVSMGVRPRVADTVFANGVSSGYAVNRFSQYINSTYPNVEHYAIKGVLHNVQLSGTANVVNLFDWDVTQFVTVADLQ